MKRAYDSGNDASAKRPRSIPTPLAVQEVLDSYIASGVLQHGELDAAILDSLSTFPPETGVEILRAFGSTDLSTIRNKPGFLAGIMKRHRTGTQDGAGYGYQDTTSASASGGGYYPSYASQGYSASYTSGDAAPMTAYPQTQEPAYADSPPSSSFLAPSVQAKLDALSRAGLLDPAELDGRILTGLSQFPTHTGEAILDKFSQADLRTVTNKSGFLAGIMKRFRASTASSAVDPLKKLAAIQIEASLPDSVQLALENIFRAGTCRREELDATVLYKLTELDEGTACDTLGRFSRANLYEIGNKAGFLVGIIKRTREERGLGPMVSRSPNDIPQSPAITDGNQYALLAALAGISQ